MLAKKDRPPMHSQTAGQEPGPRFRDVVTSPERRQHYVTSGLWTSETLPEQVDRHAARDPGRAAVVDLEGTRRTTYGQLAEDSRGVATALSQAGVGPGDVVSVQMPNWYETVAIDLGVLRLGAILNPLIPMYGAKDLNHMLGVGQTSVIVTPTRYRHADYAERVAAVSAALGRPVRHFQIPDPREDPAALSTVLSAPHAPFAPRDAAAISLLIFTSGTESAPKAVMHSEQTTTFSARQNGVFLGIDSGVVVWMPSPIGHSTGFNYGVRTALLHGGRLVLQDRWDPDLAVTLCQSERASYTSVSTTFLSDLLAVLRTRSADVSSLRYFTCAGAPIPAAVVREADSHGITVLRGYGSTETLGVGKNHPDDPVGKRINTDGTPLPLVEVELRDPEGRPVPPGGSGEVFVRGPSTSLGFAADPDRTSATFDPAGWVRTGDLAVLDADGYLSIIGRSKEIIIRGGMNIAPSEVEEALLRNPAVAEAAVIGLPDERLGEVICACVVACDPAATLTLAMLVDHLKSTGVATYKLPERIQQFSALPRGETGKVQKPALVKAVTQRQEAPATG
jgi:acyl-coenzyme A synthetase/AMP-(fatty) acid ligase